MADMGPKKGPSWVVLCVRWREYMRLNCKKLVQVASSRGKRWRRWRWKKGNRPMETGAYLTIRSQIPISSPPNTFRYTLSVLRAICPQS